MRLYYCLRSAALLVAIPGCGEKPNANQTDGVKDALDARPNEGIRDAGEHMGAAVKDAAEGIKHTGEKLKDAVEDK